MATPTNNTGNFIPSPPLHPHVVSSPLLPWEGRGDPDSCNKTKRTALRVFSLQANGSENSHELPKPLIKLSPSSSLSDLSDFDSPSPSKPGESLGTPPPQHHFDPNQGMPHLILDEGTEGGSAPECVKTSSSGSPATTTAKKGLSRKSVLEIVRNHRSQNRFQSPTLTESPEEKSEK